VALPAIIAYGAASLAIPNDVATIIFNNDDMAAKQSQGGRGQDKFYNLYGSGHSAAALPAQHHPRDDVFSRYSTVKAHPSSESGVPGPIHVEKHSLGISRRVGCEFDVREVVVRCVRGHGRNGTWFANPHLRRWPKRSTANTSDFVQITMAINEASIMVNRCDRVNKIRDHACTNQSSSRSHLTD
jgi:hypothetical protein